MSRVAKSPVAIPSAVTVKLEGENVSVKGPKGEQSFAVHPDVKVSEEDGQLIIAPRTESQSTWAMAGTMRALLNNMVTGISTGFEKKLQLIGVGYRAQAGGKSLNLSLGFSHPIDYPVPEGITIATPSATEIVISGSDKQQVGQVAAEIRAFRPPEPYKGKGVRYADEQVMRKEAKKK
jgi:large subunit ribosomal protein L6